MIMNVDSALRQRRPHQVPPMLPKHRTRTVQVLEKHQPIVAPTVTVAPTMTVAPTATVARPKMTRQLEHDQADICGVGAPCVLEDKIHIKMIECESNNSVINGNMC